ncbi:hypothetical protein [Picosynechococcus sp. OG1]|uniref:hypothetical protein n=1 Tax=Picosynechococcus sp. OG1 TaxID=1938863 RepID=UPI00117D5D5E|nr:hypothetical protein [Picosynechococcus sp. OG1]
MAKSQSITTKAMVKASELDENSEETLPKTRRLYLRFREWHNPRGNRLPSHPRSLCKKLYLPFVIGFGTTANARQFVENCQDITGIPHLYPSHTGFMETESI